MLMEVIGLGVGIWSSRTAVSRYQEENASAVRETLLNTEQLAYSNLYHTTETEVMFDLQTTYLVSTYLLSSVTVDTSIIFFVYHTIVGE